MFQRSWKSAALSAVMLWAMPASLQGETVVEPGARVTAVMGTATAESGQLRPGQLLPFGSTIQTGHDGIAIVRILWPVSTFTCLAETIVGFGGSFVVDRPAPGATCVLGEVKGNSTTTFTAVADEKGDEAGGGMPANVRADFNAFRALGEALANGMSPLRMDENLNGMDYITEAIPARSAEACSLRCATDDRCKAMTFVKSQNACWLKDSVPTATPNGDMISAIKRVNPRAIVVRP